MCRSALIPGPASLRTICLSSPVHSCINPVCAKSNILPQQPLFVPEPSLPRLHLLHLVSTSLSHPSSSVAWKHEPPDSMFGDIGTRSKSGPFTFFVLSLVLAFSIPCQHYPRRKKRFSLTFLLLRMAEHASSLTRSACAFPCHDA